MVTIDGGRGEGGGQMLRTSLALALCTGTSFRMVDVRAAREKPGLRPQHVTAVDAAASLGAADVEGALVGSREVVFRPRQVTPGDYRFAVGTAGSATLVLQTLLPALLTASGPSTLVLEGGTHNALAPPFEFIARAFHPLIERLGPRVTATLDRCGFYPAGGGRFTVGIEPVACLSPFALLERGVITARTARAIVSRLPLRIAERELAVVRHRLGWRPHETEAVSVDAAGPGNAVTLEIASEHVTEMANAVGERGVPAERVAARAVRDVLDYLAAGVPVGSRLADQLLLPLALAGGGTFLTMALTLHATTNMEVIRAFVDVEFLVSAAGASQVIVDVTRRR